MTYCIVKGNYNIYYCIPTFMKNTFYELLCDINYQDTFNIIFQECKIDLEDFIINDYTYKNKLKEMII